MKAQKAFGQTGHPNISKEGCAQYLERDRQINRPARPNKDFREKRRRANSARQPSTTFPSSDAAKAKIPTPNFGQTVKKNPWDLGRCLQPPNKTRAFADLPNAYKQTKNRKTTSQRLAEGLITNLEVTSRPFVTSLSTDIPH